MYKLCLNVEILAGTSLEDALREAKSLAKRLSLAYVCFSFNGIKISVSPNADVEKGLEKFREGKDIIVI